MSKSKYLNETGLSQLVTLMQEDTDNRIELALENVVHAGNNPEDSGEILLVNADTLDGHTADYFATAESVDELRAEVEAGGNLPDGITYVDGTESEDAELLLVDADTLGGNAADYYASKTYVAEQVADANHLTREIVTEIPTVDTAKDNVIYMYKVESATGNDVYQEYQLINGEVVMVGDTSVDLSGYVKNETVENIVNGTTVVPEATKSTFDGDGNKISETYATNVDVDMIQNMRWFGIAQAGWYRVAKLETLVSGNGANICDIIIKRVTSSASGYYHLFYNSHYNNHQFEIRNCDMPSGNHIVPKIRHTIDTTTNIAYIEIYVPGAVPYIQCIIKNYDSYYCWESIEPTLTEETVDGVTVTTTYDIPANAKPVTDIVTTKRIDLSNQVQLNAYRKSVIALCEVSTGDVVATGYFANGTITIQRGNNHSGNAARVDIFMSDNFNAPNEIFCSVSIQKYYNKTQIRPCTFNYNGKLYGGLEFYMNTAESRLVRFNGETNFNIFGLDYYDTQNNVALNDEVNNSLHFGENIKYMEYWYHNGDLLAKHKDLENYLPKTGGELSGSTANTLMKLNPTVGIDEAVLIQWLANSTALGYLGFRGINTPVFLSMDGKYNTLLHTGNKPTGEYTGTGSTESRTITVGGITSGVLHVTGNGYSAFVTQYGATVHGKDSVQYIPTAQIKYIGGVLTLATDSICVNYSGAKYSYASL